MIRLTSAATIPGITKRIGWLNFRHTYAILLESNGADVKVVQNSLSHVNAGTPMELSAEALNTSGLLHTEIVQMILPSPTLPLEAAGGNGFSIAWTFVEPFFQWKQSKAYH